MNTMTVKLVITCLLATCLMAQQQQERATTRQMYFAGLDAPAKTPLKPTPAAVNRPVVAQPAAQNVSQNVSQNNKAPLGLKYTLLKNVGGQDLEVASNTKFHSGEKIRLKVEANDNGYLYVVNQGTSGTWQVVFPAKNIADGSNRVDAGKSYDLPQKSSWKFTGPAGTEKLFIVFSREPVKGLDELLYNLHDQNKKPAGYAQSGVMMAKNMEISNGLIDQLRKSTSRDLVLATDDDEPAITAPQTGGVRIDRAVYVVNPSGSGAARVVADVSLIHQ